MALRQKLKRGDDTANARAPAASPMAEAVALGTAAGGLVMGAIQAQANDRPGADGSHVISPLAKTMGETSAEGQQADTVAQTHGPALPQTSVAAHDDTLVAPVAAAPEISHGMAPLMPQVMAPEMHQVAASPASHAEAHIIPDALPVQPLNNFAHELAGQITASLTKAIDGVGTATSPADIGLSIANDIVQSARQIVANLELGSTTGLAKSIIAEISPQDMVHDILSQTSTIANTVLSDVSVAALTDFSDLPTEILAGTSASANLAGLASLPSSILGNEGASSSGGMLSEIFYPDGAAESLAIPDLSLAAGSALPTVSADALGFLGISYLDAPSEHHMPLNALSML